MKKTTTQTLSQSVETKCLITHELSLLLDAVKYRQDNHPATGVETDEILWNYRIQIERIIAHYESIFESIK